MAQENIVNVKGYTYKIGSGEDDIKSIITNDAAITVGEAAENKIEAQDGTSYSLPGERGADSFEAEILCSEENFANVMDSVYGAGTVVGDVTTWNVENAGGTSNNIVLQSPTFGAGGTSQLTYRAINAKGLVAQPLLPKRGAAALRIKLTCDRWEFDFDASA